MGAGFHVEGLFFSYGENRVLDGLTTELPAGKFHGIVGPNGCGKSTFLDLMTRHASPDLGRITYGGKDLSSYPKKTLAREIALVPQNFYINFPFTAREVVLMGRYPHMPRFAAPSREDLEVVDRTMDETRTKEFENRYITELSGGERQRVVFARAMAQETPVLILDEATSNLDVHHTLMLLDRAAARVRDGKTVIAVFQDINLAALFCDHLVFLNGGRVESAGPTDAVLTPETLHRVFHVNAKVTFDPYCGAKQVTYKRGTV